MIQFLMVAGLLIPFLAGILLPLLKLKDRKVKLGFVFAVLVLTAGIVTALAFLPSEEVVLFRMTDMLRVAIAPDGLSRLFMLIAAWGYLAAGVFSFKYMEHEEAEGAFPEDVFYFFYLTSLGALIGMDLSSGLISMYFFFEMITLLSMPLVLHERTRESIAAALKYLFYSVAGAFLALGCIFFLSQYMDSMDFVYGGHFLMTTAADHRSLLLTMIFLGVVGFGAKAGMFPLHGWLPSAHPVAPAPASAVLSGIIAKAGVLAIIRIIYYSVGTTFLQGTWVQTAWLSLALLTVFMGSMMAYREKILKKRLAYSSVSQISYVLFGLFLMNPMGLTGGLMQVLFHACVKICLFLTAGSVIFNTGYHRVDELKGLGKCMPITFGTFTLASLSLIGIPPFAGFISKWYLALGSLTSDIPVIYWLGPVILLVSALLTAGYLLPITVQAFFPGKDFKLQKAFKEGGPLMAIPLVVLSALSLFMGLFSGSIQELLEMIVNH